MQQFREGGDLGDVTVVTRHAVGGVEGQHQLLRRHVVRQRRGASVVVATARVGLGDTGVTGDGHAHAVHVGQRHEGRLHFRRGRIPHDGVGRFAVHGDGEATTVGVALDGLHLVHEDADGARAGGVHDLLLGHGWRRGGDGLDLGATGRREAHGLDLIHDGRGRPLDLVQIHDFAAVLDGLTHGQLDGGAITHGERGVSGLRGDLRQRNDERRRHNDSRAEADSIGGSHTRRVHDALSNVRNDVLQGVQVGDGGGAQAQAAGAGVEGRRHAHHRLPDLRVRQRAGERQRVHLQRRQVAQLRLEGDAPGVAAVLVRVRALHVHVADGRQRLQ